MKKHKLLLAAFGFFATLGAVLALTNGSALAAVKTWDGGGSDDNFATAENWNGDTAPVNGDSIVLPADVIMGACSADVTLNNDLNAASVTLASITINGTLTCGSYKYLKIDGNELKLSGNLTTAGSLNTLGINIETNISTTASITISKGDTGNAYVNLVSGDTLAIGANALTLQNVGVGKDITGSGTITISQGDNNVSFSGDNSGFTGSIVVDATLSVNSANGLGSAAAGTTLNSEGYLALGGSGIVALRAEPLTFNGGMFYSGYNDGEGGIFTEEFSGSVTLTADTMFYLNFVNLKFSGSVTGAEHIKVDEGRTGYVTLPDGTVLMSALRVLVIDQANKSSYCYSSDYGLSIAKNNKYIYDVSCPEYGSKTGVVPNTSSYYDGSIYGILAGTGVLGSVRVRDGGVIAPGQSPGTLTIGNLTFEEGGSYEFEVQSAEAGQFDQIIVPGAVALGNGTLNVVLLEGYSLSAGQKMTIIDNAGGSPVNGTFKDLPEGANFAVDGVTFSISYVGGDGNDVVLTVVNIPGAPDTGFALLANNPLAVLAATTTAAGAILFIARRYGMLSKI